MGSLSPIAPPVAQLLPSRALAVSPQSLPGRVRNALSPREIPWPHDPAARSLPAISRDRASSPGREAQPESERRGPRETSAQDSAPESGPDAATGFLAQVLGQAAESGAHGPLAGHRDGPTLGSEAYRRAGGEPALYSPEPALFRLAV